MSINLERRPGRVTWESMKEELMSLPKETLAEMVSMWVRNYWTNQNYWMVCVEREFGFDNAAKLDEEVWLVAGEGASPPSEKTIRVG